MRLIKLSSIFAVLGFIFLGLSYVAAKGLEQSKHYRFPESIARHYAQVSGNVFEGSIGGEAVVLKKSIPIDPANPFDTIELETTAVDVEILPLDDEGQIEIELKTNKVDPKEPVLIDASRGKTLRIMTQEGDTNHSIGKRGWMVFNFGDGINVAKNNFLQIRIPKGVTVAKVQTASGHTKLATRLAKLQVQSKSGDFAIASIDNPLARVESLTFQTVSGDLRGPGQFDRVDFDSVSGDIKLESLDRVLAIDAQTVSGDLKLKATEPLDLAVDFHTTSGDLKVASTLLPKSASGKRALPPKSGSTIKFGKGTVQIKLHSVSGDLKIQDASTVNSNDDEDTEATDHDDEANLKTKPSKEYAEEFLQCAAKIAAREQTRIGASAARRCLRVNV